MGTLDSIPPRRTAHVLFSAGLALMLAWASPAHAAPGTENDTEQVMDVAVMKDGTLLQRAQQALWSPQRSYTAMVHAVPLPENPETKQDVLLLYDAASNTLYRLQHNALPHRPIEDVQWVGPNRLQFDIWANPRFGHRYTLDASTRQIVKEAELPAP